MHKTRVNPAELAAFKQSRKVWYVGLYIRLSKEDEHLLKHDDSGSINNQVKILRRHFSEIKDGDIYHIVKIFIDDGVSGTTDEKRENFQEMLAYIVAGKINCVAVKDLARSFRNYSDQGYYLDDFFPRYNIRFISLYHQTLDSYKAPYNMRNISVPIQGLINENHCAETSDKVRAVFDLKRSNGEHIGSFAPFGYLKNPNDKNALIIDEAAAAVVRNIYSSFLGGMSKNAIVRSLNEQGILCPALYKREVLKQKYTNPNLDATKKPLWSATSVTTILKNRMYCGDMVQGRYRKKSYKIHVQERMPENEWYIVENTHESIIERSLFEKAQVLLTKNTRTGPQQKELYLFSGYLRCADCGKAMARSQVKGNIYYFCRTYKDQSKTACSKHSFKHCQLEKAVLYAIQQQIYLAVDYWKTIAIINKAPLYKSPSVKLQNALEQREKQLANIARYKQLVWQDWKDGLISQMEYLQMSEGYSSQMQELEQIIDTLRAERKTLKHEVDATEPFFKAYKKFQNIEKLTRDVLVELVEQIKIYENGNISIKFKFIDEIQRVYQYVVINTQSEVV
ncbi:recombinase family protein [Paenibacillus sp. FSL K6-1096]|uniref:recombinase family protein n=1 Tax=Paenibacillus sp. FSL K6-1096 TaxID=2921460 RepID=UPI0030EDE893